jgi:hypothetical protein
MQSKTLFFGCAVVGTLGLFLVGTSFHPQQKGGANKAQIERGKFYVTVGGCNDCHSPKIFTPQGPVIDSTRLLSGHPATEPVPGIPQGVLGPGKWGALTNGHLTAWAGPWGVSFTRNLTPDIATGIGSWTEEIFIKAMRTGKDMGEGRDILPPMPWFNFAQMSDGDLKAIFAYLKSLKPIQNAVPDPISPTGQTIPSMKPPKQ